MRKVGLAAVVAASLVATGCATYPNQYGYDPYGYNNGYYNNGYYNQGYTYDSQGRRVATGAIGGGGGGGGSRARVAGGRGGPGGGGRARPSGGARAPAPRS